MAAAVATRSVESLPTRSEFKDRVRKLNRILRDERKRENGGRLGRSRFVILEDDKISTELGSTEETISYLTNHTNARAIEIDSWREMDLAKMKKTAQNAHRISSPNFIGKLLSDLSKADQDAITWAVGMPFGDQPGHCTLDEDVSNAGVSYERGGDKTATDEESMYWSVNLSLETRRIDLRKKLAPQVAKWLRQVAAKLSEAANEVDAVEEVANRTLIRQLASGQTTIKDLEENDEIAIVKRPYDGMREVMFQEEFEDRYAGYLDRHDQKVSATKGDAE